MKEIATGRYGNVIINSSEIKLDEIWSINCILLGVAKSQIQLVFFFILLICSGSQAIRK